MSARHRLECGCSHNDKAWLTVCVTHGHYRAQDVPVPSAVLYPVVQETLGTVPGRSENQGEWLDE